MCLNFPRKIFKFFLTFNDTLARSNFFFNVILGNFYKQLFKDGPNVSPAADDRRFVDKFSLALYFVPAISISISTFHPDTAEDFVMAERPEDLNLPSAVVSRIIKDALPPQVRILASVSTISCCRSKPEVES